MTVFDRSKYFRSVQAYSVQYGAPVLLFDATPLILVYYSELAVRGSTGDNTRA